MEMKPLLGQFIDLNNTFNNYTSMVTNYTLPNTTLFETAEERIEGVWQNSSYRSSNSRARDELISACFQLLPLVAVAAVIYKDRLVRIAKMFAAALLAAPVAFVLAARD